MEIHSVKIYPADIHGLLDDEYLSYHAIYALLSMALECVKHAFIKDSLFLALKRMHDDPMAHTVRWFAKLKETACSKIRTSKIILFPVNYSNAMYSSKPLPETPSPSLSHWGLILLDYSDNNLGFTRFHDSLQVLLAFLCDICDDYAEPAVLLQLITVYLSYYST